ncbi:MAG: dual specificity protein phosphatase family protein [Candidatus Hodarchaeota archaeon]
MSAFKIDWIIENVLAASSYPTRTDLQTIWKQGIRTIVTLRSNPLPYDWLADFQFEYLHLPIHDFFTPTFEQIEQFVKFIDLAQKKESPVLVHCFAGLGRTGTMISCYLVSKGMKTEEAVHFIRQIRPGSVETAEQLAIIEEYERNLPNKI